MSRQFWEVLGRDSAGMCLMFFSRLVWPCGFGEETTEAKGSCLHHAGRGWGSVLSTGLLTCGCDHETLAEVCLSSIASCLTWGGPGAGQGGQGLHARYSGSCGAWIFSLFICLCDIFLPVQTHRQLFIPTLLFILLPPWVHL